MSKVELLDECNNTLGEGITYSSTDNFLYWLDIGNISYLYKIEEKGVILFILKKIFKNT